MNLKLEAYIAFRYLKSKKEESFIAVVSLFSLIGTALGVAALIAVMSVMAGVRQEWSNMLVGAMGEVNIYSSAHSGIKNFDYIIQKLKASPFISDATPVIEKQALLATERDNSGVQVRGIRKNDLDKKQVIANKMVFGSLSQFEDNAIIIGEALANNLKIIIGDKVKIISPQTTSVLVGNVPRIKTCEVVGIFNSGAPDLDNLTVFMPLDLAQKFFKLTEEVSLIEINAKTQNYTTIKQQIDAEFQNQFRIVDWTQRNASLMNALEIEKMAMFMILTLIMIVAAFNIISGLIMLVKDKTSDIAILRTMGATKSMIVRIFLISGSAIGIMGTGLGVLLGVSFAKNVDNIRRFLEKITGTTIFDPLVYFLSFLPAKVQVSDVISITLMSLTLSVLATIYPAYRAAKLNPAIILK